MSDARAAQESQYGKCERERSCHANLLRRRLDPRSSSDDRILAEHCDEIAAGNVFRVNLGMDYASRDSEVDGRLHLKHHARDRWIIRVGTARRRCRRCVSAPAFQDQWQHEYSLHLASIAWRAYLSLGGCRWCASIKFCGDV